METHKVVSITKKFRSKSKVSNESIEENLTKIFKGDVPNQIWVTDITYICTKKDGCIYHRL